MNQIKAQSYLGLSQSQLRALLRTLKMMFKEIDGAPEGAQKLIGQLKERLGISVGNVIGDLHFLRHHMSSLSTSFLPPAGSYSKYTVRFK